MSYRQNFRGRQDDRYGYNQSPGRGGRGGYNNRNNAGVGGFLNQRRDTFPQHDRQQNRPNSNAKPSVNQPAKATVTGVTSVAPIATKTAPAVSPAVSKQKEVTKPLISKELPKKIEKQEHSNNASNTKGNHVEKAPPTKPTNPSPAKKPAAPDVNKSTERDRSGSHKRPNTGYQGNQQNRGGSNQGDHERHEHGPRHGGSGRGRFDNRNSQERSQTSRFSSPPGGQRQEQFQGQGGEEQYQQMYTPHPEFGDDLMTEIKMEKKFTGRCRLFIGNLPNETTDEQFKKMFEKFGEISEVFLNKHKMFGFIRLDTRLNAEAAKTEMDGATFKGRIIRVRFAAHGAALKVKNLPSVVSNELLEEAFSNFGEVERAIVIVDDRGKSTSEGIVEFARKPAAQAAIKKIKEGVFLMTASTRPIMVEPLEQKNDEDGLPEKNVSKNPNFYQEREGPPRFAQRNSFEYEWGQRWKQQAIDEDRQRAELETKIVEDRKAVMQEVELARHDYHTMQMRQELLHRQKELERLEEQRKSLEARHQGLQMQREGFGGQGGMMGEDPGSMLRQQQEVNLQQQQQQNMELQQQQGMRAEEMNRMEADRFASGGGSSAHGLPAALLMEGSEKGMMGQNQDNMQNQRQSRFDVGPGAGAAFNANGRGSLAGAGMGVAAALGQQENAMGANFGSLQGGAGGMGAGNNPRPLMEELGQEMMGEFNPKRARRY